MKKLQDGVWVSGRLDVADVPELARRGFRVLVNHRPDGEEPGQPTAAELAAAAEVCGILLVHAPVSGWPDAAAVQATADALDQAGDGEALLFCRSGMRSAAAWALALRAQGVSVDEVRLAAGRAGYDLGRFPL